jgi:hypothetical protein
MKWEGGEGGRRLGAEDRTVNSEGGEGQKKAAFLNGLFFIYSAVTLLSPSMTLLL